MNNWKYIGVGILMGLFMGSSLFGQALRGELRDEERNRPLANVEITLLPGGQVATSNKKGLFEFDLSELSEGPIQLEFSSGDGRFDSFTSTQNYTGEDIEVLMEVKGVAVVLETERITDAAGGAAYLRSVEGMAIYAAKKTELIHPDSLLANAAANNARRLFVRVPGLNIWESDPGGLQLGIGGRGLSPNRTSNFNVRQNGYDIAADALGYPESYYTPPAEAVDRIEVVRGAASLQYGTQFGGMVNFLFKAGDEEKPVAFRTRNTLGSFGFVNTFNSIGGTVANDKINYYAFGQFRRGDGWRANSGFQQYTGFASVNAALSPRVRLGAEYTRMQYLAQQPGGLTDALFEQGSRESLRDRNWFRVQWNLAAVTADVDLSDRTRLNVRNFGLFAYRHALGFLGSINRVDPLDERDLLKGDFLNLGNETRLLHRYSIAGRPSALLLGTRLYRGQTRFQQGFGSDSTDANFEYIDPIDPGQSEFDFPNVNIAVFAEQWINLTDRLSLTPGLRYEFISTESEGYFYQRAFDFAGNLLTEERVDDQRDLNRNLLLAGLGLAFKSTSSEIYGNFSQNYRAITFSDLRVVNPNFQVDENLRDERGFNADLGWRGQASSWLAFDMSVFVLRYNDRIGNVLRVDSTDFNYFRYRTNIADAVNTGFEGFVQADLADWWFGAEQTQFTVFANLSLIHARYVDSDEPAFDGNAVELVPPFTLRTGFNFRRGDFRANLQFSHTAGHYSDATNAERSPTSVEGFIPSYNILDAALAWEHQFPRFRMAAELGGQNLLDEYYFTRRATGYPGPGIIPADIRNFYLSIEFGL